jgi:hypothetical protein
MPEMGTDIAIDASDLPAYANGQRFVSKGGRERERRSRRFAAETCALDKGYDVSPVYEALEDRDCRPIMPLRETPAVKRGDIARPGASMASGGSPEATTAVKLLSGGVRPASTSRGVGGSRLTVCIVDPARVAPLVEALQGPRRRRARVRSAQE